MPQTGKIRRAYAVNNPELFVKGVDAKAHETLTRRADNKKLVIVGAWTESDGQDVELHVIYVCPCGCIIHVERVAGDDDPRFVLNTVIQPGPRAACVLSAIALLD